MQSAFHSEQTLETDINSERQEVDLASSTVDWLCLGTATHHSGTKKTALPHRQEVKERRQRGPWVSLFLSVGTPCFTLSFIAVINIAV